MLQVLSVSSLPDCALCMILLPAAFLTLAHPSIIQCYFSYYLFPFDYAAGCISISFYLSLSYNSHLEDFVFCCN